MTPPDTSCHAHDGDIDAQSVRRITECQLSLYSFIASLVSNHTDVEDIRQNTNLVLWKKVREIPAIENIHAYARKVAHLEVLKYRRRVGRASLLLDDDALAMVADMAEKKAELLEQRRTALQNCVQKLSEDDRELLKFRYHQGMKLCDAAELIGRSASSVRHSMSRIRRQLKRCVDWRLTAGESP